MVTPADTPPTTARPEAPAPTDDATQIVRPAGTAEQRTPASSEPPQRTRRPRHLEPGQLLAHTYEIEARLGRGGMGEVYRAQHIKLHSLHAIKMIAPELVDDVQIIDMFTEEARKLRMVRNDAVVSYDGLIGDEDGLLYLIMEFVDGISLADVIRERALAPDEVRALRDRLAQGLGAAHDKLIYHRDISPDNIILVGGRVDQAKIIDFGIAKSGAAGDRTIIGSGFAGKFSYISPEQLGMCGGVVDGRSDIYSLGLVLVAAALGHALDMGNSPASAVEARRQIPDLSALPTELRAEIAPLLEPDPANRPASMRLLPGSPTVVAPAPRIAGALNNASSPARRAPWPLLLAGGGGLIVAGIAVAFWLRSATPPATTAETAPPTVATKTAPPAAPAPTPPTVTASASPSSPDTGASAPPAAVAPGGANSAPSGTPPAATRPETASLAIAPAPIDPRVLSAQLASFSRDLGCADLTSASTDSASPTVIGFVTSANARSRLARMLDGSPNLEHAQNSVSVRPWAQCDNAVGLMRSAGALDAPATAPRLDFNSPNRNYRLGDKLIMRVTNNAASDGYLYIDFIDSSGSVAHLLPRPGGPRNTVHAGQTMTLGDSADSVLEISEPLGPNLILAVFSSQPLFAARGDETADRYLPVLSRAVTAGEHRPEAERPGATYAFVNALPR